MKELIKSVAGYFGYEISKAHSRKDGFTVGDLKFETNPCCVGKTPEGVMAAEGAERMIREREFQNLKVLDIGCGVGVIGLSLFANLSRENIIDEIVLTDINIFNLYALERTLVVNDLDSLLGDQIRYYLSDGLRHLPKDEQFDLIISNPPHYAGKERKKTWQSPGRVATYDAGWSFRKAVYRDCHKLLKPDGEVWFFENGSATNEKALVPYIEANAQLEYQKQEPEPLNSRFVWMISQKSSVPSVKASKVV